MSHRINIEDALDTFTGEVEVGVANEADFLAVLYAWRDEAVTDALRGVHDA
jgi:hypothetical protein